MCARLEALGRQIDDAQGDNTRHRFLFSDCVTSIFHIDSGDVGAVAMAGVVKLATYAQAACWCQSIREATSGVMVVW